VDRDGVVETFLSYLRDHNLPVTQQRDFGEGFKRFEPARDIPQHEHLLCTVCGRVTEFQDERLERITTLAAVSHGYLRQSHRLVIHGVCATCRSGSAIN
jgi:Fur family ferric uptake transcriptional regulator